MTEKSLMLGFFFFVALCGPLTATEDSHSVEVISDVFTIDQKYAVMRGPSSHKQLTLPDADEPELLWLTEARIKVMSPEGSEDFLCHSFIDLDKKKHSVKEHNALFGNTTHWRHKSLFAFGPGNSLTKFPEGFGVPIRSDEPLDFAIRIASENFEGGSVQVRFKANITYQKDQDLEQPMKPLFQRVLSVVVKENGVRAKGGWKVGTGRHIYRYPVSERLNLPFDTTLHYMHAHLHAFAESLELRDLTAGESVFKIQALNYEDRIGIAHMNHFSSKEGIPLYKDHEYEMVSIYNNPTSKDRTAMAMFRLYLLNKDFRRSAMASR